MAKKITKKALKAQKAMASKPAVPASDEPTEAQDGFKDKQNFMWVILTGALAVLITTLLFFPENLGVGITSVYSLMLWWGLFSMFLFRYLGKRGVIGFIGGSALGMFIQIFSPLFMHLLA